MKKIAGKRNYNKYARTLSQAEIDILNANLEDALVKTDSIYRIISDATSKVSIAYGLINQSLIGDEKDWNDYCNPSKPNCDSASAAEAADALDVIKNSADKIIEAIDALRKL